MWRRLLARGLVLRRRPTPSHPPASHHHHHHLLHLSRKKNGDISYPPFPSSLFCSSSFGQSRVGGPLVRCVRARFSPRSTTKWTSPLRRIRPSAALLLFAAPSLPSPRRRRRRGN